MLGHGGRWGMVMGVGLCFKRSFLWAVGLSFAKYASHGRLVWGFVMQANSVAFIWRLGIVICMEAPSRGGMRALWCSMECVVMWRILWVLILGLGERRYGVWRRVRRG